MKIFGIPIDEITYEQAKAALNRPQVIFTPNPEILLKARKNQALARALKKGTLFLPDGHGLALVSSLLPYPKISRVFLYIPALILFLFRKKPFQKILPEVIHGSDFMCDLLEWSQGHQKKVYFLGAGPGIAQKTAEFFIKRYPKLRVVGFSSLDPSHEAFAHVKKSHAQVLLVAYGAPKQEIWMAKYVSHLPDLFHAMAVGGAFDFWSGKVKRAPDFLRKLGLEWTWRLIIQPKIRLCRVWNATVKFPLITLFFS